jgi:hypothetical protein
MAYFDLYLPCKSLPLLVGGREAAVKLTETFDDLVLDFHLKSWSLGLFTPHSGLKIFNMFSASLLTCGNPVPKYTYSKPHALSSLPEE